MSKDRVRDSVRGHLNPRNQVKGLYHGGGQQWDSLRRDASIFGGSMDRQREEAEAAAQEQAMAQQAQQMAAQMFGQQYQGGQVTGGGGQGIMAAPMVVTPQQTPNMGLPGMQNLGQAGRGDFAQFLQQMRQGVPVGGYNPVMPRTIMPPPQMTPQQPQQPQQPQYGGNIPSILSQFGAGNPFMQNPAMQSTPPKQGGMLGIPANFQMWR